MATFPRVGGRSSGEQSARDLPFGLPERTSLDYQKVFKPSFHWDKQMGFESAAIGKEKKTQMEEAGNFNCVPWNLDAMEHINM